MQNLKKKVRNKEDGAAQYAVKKSPLRHMVNRIAKQRRPVNVGWTNRGS